MWSKGISKRIKTKDWDMTPRKIYFMWTEKILRKHFKINHLDIENHH